MPEYTLATQWLFGLIQYKNRTYHKQMRQQRADDHTVRRKQESGIESKPADESGVTCHQDKQWQFFPEAVKCA